MILSLTQEISAEELADGISIEDAENVIFAIDSRMADFDFTVSIVKRMIQELDAECRVDGERFDMAQVTPYA